MTIVLSRADPAGIGAVTLALLFGLFNLIAGAWMLVQGIELRRTGKTLHPAARERPRPEPGHARPPAWFTVTARGACGPPATARAGVLAPPGDSAHATPALPLAIPLWLSGAVPCIGTVTAPLASPRTLAEGCGESTRGCGAVMSRPVTVRVCAGPTLSRLATLTEMGRGPSGIGASATILWY